MCEGERGRSRSKGGWSIECILGMYGLGLMLGSTGWRG
jgi:hypothetical protein